VVRCKSAVSLAVVAFAVAACGQQPASTEPNGPRPTTAGKIAFLQGINPANIYVMNADGTGQSKLTGGDDSAPAWSPDGKQIVFARTAARAPASASGPTPPSSRQIWVMNADGSGQAKLTESAGGDYFPVWSPIGDKIAFVRIREPDGLTTFPGKIYVMNADGSNPTQVTFGDFADSSPAWSPDGKRIAFARYPFTAGETSGPGQIYVINPDGTGLTKLEGKGNDSPYTKSLSWSPDGRKIAFEGQPSTPSNDHLFVMNADGTGQTKVTSGRGDGWPTWSPDGTAIAFESHRDSRDLYGFARDIYVINSNGTGVVRLTTFADAWAWQPAWSPVYH